MRIISVYCVIVCLVACSVNTPEFNGVQSDKALKEYLFHLDEWFLDGRMSITGANESWSANIIWRHYIEIGEKNDRIELLGPLGQKALLIQLTDKKVSIDRGKGDVLLSNNPSAFITQQLGVFVPIDYLRYWVVGLTSPKQESEAITNGFVQAGWRIEYQQLQNVHNHLMPRKIMITGEQVKLKLVVDEWVLDGTDTR